MTDLRGRVALVTGASSGIGRAVAERLASAGMKMALLARRTERLGDLQSTIAAAGGQAAAFPADLRREEAVVSAFAAVRKKWGGIDVLINNAGLGRQASLMAGDTHKWREMLEVNVLGLCICTREALTDMRTRGDTGHVIHISSMAGHRVPQGSGVYSATKFAVRSLTEGLRQELREAGSKIRVTAISPGYVETEFAEVFHQSKALAQQTYEGFEVLQPQDVAELVWFALSRPPHVQLHDLLVRATEQTD